MEVHHSHDKHHKKNWKSYLFEFFMLFLAITAGFLVENMREKRVEHMREREYIHSFLNDLSMDTSKVNYTKPLNDTLMMKIDSMVTYINNHVLTDEQLAKAYQIKDEWLSSLNNVVFTERTISQLKSAGGLRLIEKQNSSDLIVQYYEFVSVCNEQANYYKYDQTALIELSYKLFYKDYNKRFGNNWDAARKILKEHNEILQEFINRLIDFKEVVSSYNQLLNQIKIYNHYITPLIKKDYKITDR